MQAKFDLANKQTDKALKSNQVSFRPAKGSSIKVEPIKDLKAIKRIKQILADNPRDLCLFTLGINTAYRAGELLSIKVGQVEYLNAGDSLTIRQTKTGKLRSVTLNQTCINSIQSYLTQTPLKSSQGLFTGQRGVLTVSSVNRLVKRWCSDVGLRGNYGSHTLRKTFGYQQRVKQGAPLPLLVEAFGHTTQKQTLDYLCIQEEEIRDLYLSMEL